MGQGGLFGTPFGKVGSRLPAFPSLHHLPCPPHASSILAGTTASKIIGLRGQSYPSFSPLHSNLSYLNLQRNKLFVHYEVYVEESEREYSSQRNGEFSLEQSQFDVC